MTRRVIGGAAVMSAFSMPSDAHMLSTGVGPFYDGMTHLFVTPTDFLTVIALSIVGGLGHETRGRHMLLAGLLGWAVGISVGALSLVAEWRPPYVFSGITIALGLLAALDSRLPRVIFTSAALAVGLVLGCSAGSGLASLNYSFQLGLGMFTGVAIATCLLTATASSRPDNWQRIAIRVAGSWIVAVGMLTFAFELRQLS